MPYEEEDTFMLSYEEEDTACHTRRRIHACNASMSYEEEDTCMPYEEEDTACHTRRRIHACNASGRSRTPTALSVRLESCERR
jgi:hypothetical protein